LGGNAEQLHGERIKGVVRGAEQRERVRRIKPAIVPADGAAHVRAVPERSAEASRVRLALIRVVRDVVVGREVFERAEVVEAADRTAHRRGLTIAPYGAAVNLTLRLRL